MKTWGIVFLAIALLVSALVFILFLKWAIDTEPDATVSYYLVRSDTAYTYTSTRGNGMTIINYYDKGPKK